MGPAPAPWEFVHLKDTVQSAEHVEERAGSTGREAGTEENMLLDLWVSFGICFGKVPFLRLEVTVRKASWGLRVAQLPCYLPLMEDTDQC